MWRSSYSGGKAPSPGYLQLTPVRHVEHVPPPPPVDMETRRAQETRRLKQELLRNRFDFEALIKFIDRIDDEGFDTQSTRVEEIKTDLVNYGIEQMMQSAISQGLPLGYVRLWNILHERLFFAIGHLSLFQSEDTELMEKCDDFIEFLQGIYNLLERADLMPEQAANAADPNNY